MGGTPREPLERAWWCLHCFRVFARTEESEYDAGVPDPSFNIKPGVPGKKCPYEGCNGSPIDFFPWGEFNPAFGEKPYEGVIYPNYPKFPARS